jgi:Fe(3+) dicitrate transport protein
MRLWVVGCSLLAVAAGAAKAGQATGAPAPEAMDEAGLAAAGGGDSGDIIVIGARENLLIVPGSGSIIDETDLERARVFTLNEALRQAPGVFVRDEEGLGLRPNIGIRGLNPVRSTKILLLEDGIPLGFAPYGDNAYYYHPPIDRFARIEVLKGAAQIRFGPQSIGGVINYITPEPPEAFGGRATLAGGTRGYVEGDATLGGPLAGGRGLLHLNHTRSDGSRANQRLRLYDLYAKQRWELREGAVLTLRGSLFREDSDITYSGLTRAEFAASPRGNPFPRGNDEFQTWRAHGSATLALEADPALRLSLTGYYHYFERDWWRQSSNSGQRPNDASDPACGGMANLLTSCGTEGRLRAYDTYGAELRAVVDHDIFGLGLGGETEIGLRAHRDEQRRRQWNADTPRGRTPGTGVNGGVRENQKRLATALSAFVQSRLELGPLSIQPGVRMEFIDYVRRDLGTSQIVAGRPTGLFVQQPRGDATLSQVIPGIGATLRLAEGVSLYGGAHRGFAPPRVEDIITAAGGSVDLDAELSWNYELGVRGVAVRGLSFDLTAFQMDFGNQIVPASVAGGVGAVLTSAGRTQHRGLEGAFKLSSRDAGWTDEGLDLFARTAVTWVERARYASTRIATPPCFDGATPGTPVLTGRGPVPCGRPLDVEGNRLPYAPEWIWSAAVGAELGWVTGQVEVQGQSSLFADDVNLVPVTPDGQRGRVEGWAVVNAAVTLAPPDWPVRLFFTAKNIGDKLYIADRARGILPGTPRLFQGGVEWRF